MLASTLDLIYVIALLLFLLISVAIMIAFAIVVVIRVMKDILKLLTKKEEIKKEET